jgi:hypothetical protein
MIVFAEQEKRSLGGLAALLNNEWSARGMMRHGGDRD